jgi:AcrR family transcriptional regulator
MVKARHKPPPRPERSRTATMVEREGGLEPGATSKPASAKTAASARQGKPARARKVTPEARRQAILAAALTVFAAHGFEAARLDDVAQRAGVAKGTLYLHFRDKEALFEALVRSAVSPLLEQMSRIAAASDIPPVQALETFFALFETQVLGTERKLLLRLIMAEGPRFPAIAEFYYREVVAHGLRMMRALATRAAGEGAFATDAAARYPQLIVAPLLLAVLWEGLFAKIDPLDVGAFLRAHREMLTGGARKGTP